MDGLFMSVRNEKECAEQSISAWIQQQQFQTFIGKWKEHNEECIKTYAAINLNHVVTFCKPTEWFISFTKLCTNMSKPSVEWVRLDIIVKLLSSCHALPGIYND